MNFISQGSYGCVYSSKRNRNNRHNKITTVSKIQIVQDIDKETMLGEIIQKIFQYESYFAPILETHPIDIGVIQKKESTQCNILKSNNNSIKERYINSRIRYVGNHFLDNFIYNKVESNDQRNSIFDTHLHILKGIQKLIELTDPIIHHDIKNKNILMDKLYDIPIIIDFGLSFTKKELDESFVDDKKITTFFFPYKLYIPWTIEFTLLSYLVNNIILKQKNHINIHIDKIDKHVSLLVNIIHQFVKENFIFINNHNYINKKVEFINRMEHYIESFRTKTIHDLIQDLSKNWKSWDNYSVAIMFYNIIENFTKNDFKLKKDHYIQLYQQLLLDIILSTPNIIRLIPIDTYESILLFAKIK